MERIVLIENGLWDPPTQVVSANMNLEIKLDPERFENCTKNQPKNKFFSNIKLIYSSGIINSDDANRGNLSEPILKDVEHNTKIKSLDYLGTRPLYLSHDNQHLDHNETECVGYSSSSINNENSLLVIRVLGDGNIQKINLNNLICQNYIVPNERFSKLGFFDSGAIHLLSAENLYFIPNKSNFDIQKYSIPKHSIISFDKNFAYINYYSDLLNETPDIFYGLNSPEWDILSQDGSIQRKKIDTKKYNIKNNDDFSIYPSRNVIIINSRPRFQYSEDGEKFYNMISGEGGDNIFSAISLLDGSSVSRDIRTQAYCYASSLQVNFDEIFSKWKALSLMVDFLGVNGNRIYGIFLQGPTNIDNYTIATGFSELPYLLKCKLLNNGDVQILFSHSDETRVCRFSVSEKRVVYDKQWLSPSGTGAAYYIDEANLLFIPRVYGYDAIKIVETNEPELAFSLHLGATGSYAVVLPNGSFAGSPGCEGLINLLSDDSIVDASVLLPWRNRPAEVLKALSGDPAQIEVLSKVTERWLKKLGNPERNPEPSAADIPTLSLSNEVPLWAKGEQVSLKFTAKTGTAPVKEVVVRVNGVDHQRGANSADGKSEIERSIKLAEGQNWIEAVAIDEKGRTSNLLRFRTILPEASAPAKRFIIAMGVSKYRDSSMNLEFAAKDATDLSNAFKASTNGPSEVLLLTNDQVTRESLDKIRAFLANATENDEVVAFCAGHGVLDSNLDYVYASHEFDAANPSATGIKLDDLVDAIGSSKSLKRLLLLDTCHAGQVGEKEEILLAQMDTNLPSGVRAVKQRGMSVKPATGLSAEGQQRFIEEMFLLPGLHRGINIIGASGGAEYALESAQWNNGVFTATIIEALRDKKADLDGDARISVSELRDYLGQRVSELTKGAQKPSAVASERDQDFDLIRVATTGRKTLQSSEDKSDLPPEPSQAVQGTEAIIRDYYRAVVSRDESAVQSFFADSVNYLSYGNQSKAKVLADHRGDWKRYSGSQFEVSNFVSTGPSSCQFIVDYSLMQGERPRRGKLQMTATFTDSLPHKITSLQAKVISAK
jgi:uncharacterized caspase-like protein